MALCLGLLAEYAPSSLAVKSAVTVPPIDGLPGTGPGPIVDPTPIRPVPVVKKMPLLDGAPPRGAADAGPPTGRCS